MPHVAISRFSAAAGDSFIGELIARCTRHRAGIRPLAICLDFGKGLVLAVDRLAVGLIGQRLRGLFGPKGLLAKRSAIAIAAGLLINLRDHFEHANENRDAGSAIVANLPQRKVGHF